MRGEKPDGLAAVVGAARVVEALVEAEAVEVVDDIEAVLQVVVVVVPNPISLPKRFYLDTTGDSIFYC